MKIAFISLLKILPWGGSEELWLRAAHIALKQGHEVYSITQKWQSVPKKIEGLQIAGATTVFYQVPEYSVKDRALIKLRLKQRESMVVPEIDADIYVFSCGTVFDISYSQNIVHEILRNSKPYIIINQHNYESGFIPSEVQRDYFIKILIEAKKCLFVSQRNMTTAVRQLSSGLPNAVIIDNPVNISAPAIKAYPSSNKLLMACVARLDCNFKGQDILLEALSSKQWQERNYQLNFYGTGPHHDHLERLVKLYNLSDKVNLVGHVSNIDELWEKNQVLILPSLSEGTPLSLIEAMLSGRSALVTDVGGNSQYITDKTGFLASTASVDCLTKSLEELWNKKESLQELGESAFHHAKAITNLMPEVELLNYITS